MIIALLLILLALAAAYIYKLEKQRKLLLNCFAPLALAARYEKEGEKMVTAFLNNAEYTMSAREHDDLIKMLCAVVGVAVVHRDGGVEPAAPAVFAEKLGRNLVNNMTTIRSRVINHRVSDQES